MFQYLIHIFLIILGRSSRWLVRFDETEYRSDTGGSVEVSPGVTGVGHANGRVRQTVGSLTTPDDRLRPTTVSTRKNARPWLAVLLAFLYPGLGHVYLREWLRALVWFFLNVTSFALLIPESAVPETVGVDSLLRAAENFPPEAALALASITIFSMIDAYWMAKRDTEAQEATGEATCPNCGRDVDPDLEFCHWCTERLSPDSDGDDSGTGV